MSKEMLNIIEDIKAEYINQSQLGLEFEVKWQKEVKVDMEAWNSQKDEMVRLSNALHFSNMVPLIDRAVIAEKKLIRLREEMFRKDNTIHTGFIYDK